MSSHHQQLNTAQPLQVFLCYSSIDKPEVLMLYEWLKTKNLELWFDEENLLPGQRWEEEIRKAICNADVVLICLSNRSVDLKGYVHKEIQVALEEAELQPENSIFLIPIRLEDCQVPKRLNNWQWFDLFKNPDYIKLMKSLHQRAEKLGRVIPAVSNEVDKHDSAMKQPVPQVKVPVDEVVIRFTRQIFFADDWVFQAEVRKTPILLWGGHFRADIEQLLDELRLTFTNRVRHEHSYRDGPDEIDPNAEQTAQELKELGCALYDLLPDPIRTGLPRLLQHASDRGRYLRLVLEARAGDQADLLLSMPWEIVFIDPLQNYLGLLPRVMLVRRLVDTVRLRPVTFQPPFNILHVIADAEKSEYPPLDPGLQQAECTAIAQTVAPGGSYHLVAQPGSIEAMQAALQAKRYQVVHFLGHGDIAPQTQQGYLIFASADGMPQFVTGEQLQRRLTITPDVQLVVLNACKAAQATITGGSVVALKLVYGGIPYVIAMQDEILPNSAGVFARTFYSELQRGKSIEMALMDARHAIAAASELVIDWSLPALYTNVGIAEEGPFARARNQFKHWLNDPVHKIWFPLVLLGIVDFVVTLLWGSILFLVASTVISVALTIITKNGYTFFNINHETIPRVLIETYIVCLTIMLFLKFGLPSLRYTTTSQRAAKSRQEQWRQRQQILQIISQGFSQEDLKTLCFDLNVDYDILEGDEKIGNPRELILHLERHGRINELIETVKELRSHVHQDNETKKQTISDYGK